ncbi:MAG TPA: substrate-binding domain-containing protein [Kribbella sp.]
MLAAERRSRIIAQARRSGAVRVTDIAGTLGVSEATVRRDLDSLVADGLLDKVYGGATLSSAAPVNGAIQIGVVIPAATAYYPRILDGIRDLTDNPDAGLTVNLALSRRGENPTLESVVAAERELITALIDSGVDGLLLLPALGSREQLNDVVRSYEAWLAELPVPAVLMERELPSMFLSGPSTVRTAHERGAAGAVRHLSELGHRRIALLARTDTQTAELVHTGWRQASTELGLPADVPFLAGKSALNWPGWNAGDLDAILEQLREQDVTALLCHSDEDALTLLRHARSRGVDVPHGLSVVAYEDELAALAHPALTAVAPPRRQVGQVAVQTLLRLINDAGDGATRHLTLDPQLTRRASTVGLDDSIRAD